MTDTATIEQPITLIGDEPPQRALIANPTPSDLLRIAVTEGADLDRLERLMALQERWQQGEARNAYNRAFAAFKAEAIVIIKNKTVSQGPLAGGKYAELFAVVNAVTPALSKHGLSTSWKLTRDDKEWLEVTCTLKHEAGHFEVVSMGGPPDTGGAKSALQARASTKTFLERYTLKAILGVAEQGDDNDGGNVGSTEVDPALQKGRDAAMEGTPALTTWWSSLTAKQRGAWSKEFGQLRKDAAAVDRGVAHE